MKAVHTIDERCAYLDYVFGYDDTERITVRFELGPSDALYTVQVLEDGEARTRKFEISEVADDWQPKLGSAEDILLRYWAGELKHK